MAKTIRVLLADDHPLVRSGVRATLANEPGVELIGEATDGNEAQQMCSALRPDLMLLDLSMPGPSPLETIAYTREHCAEVKILILTAYDDDTYIRGLMGAGIDGYLLKDEAAEALMSAIATIHGGGTWFSRSVAQKMFEWRTSDKSNEKSAAFDLTRREEEMLVGIAQGWDNKRIADEYTLAEQTVRNYISRIYDKLNLHSRAEVVVWARQQGFAKD